MSTCATEPVKLLDEPAGIPSIRVAFVRGPFTNDAELAPVERLGKGVSVTVVSSTRTPLHTSLRVQKTTCLGTLLESVPKVRRVYRDSLERLFGNPMYLTKLDQIVQEHDVIDVAETYNFFSAQIATLTRKYDKKLVVSVYENTPFFKENIPSVRRTKNWVRSSAATFIAKTQQIKRCLTAEGVDPRRVEVIYSGVDTNVFCPQAKNPATLQRFSLKPTDIVFLQVGRLVWEKGVADAIRSLGVFFLKDQFPRRAFKLLIVGTGREKAHLSQLVDALGISDHVIFGGAVQFAEMPKIYSVADVCLLGSKPYPGGQEQEARVIRESLACGKPMIAAQCGGSGGSLGDAGVLVPPADHIALSDTMAELACNPERRSELGKRGRQRALKYFDVLTVANQMERVYTSAPSPDSE